MYDITETILAYYDDCKGNETRYKSWEHCYKHFRLFLENKNNPEYLDLAALHLGFYLASWGMYRGSSFLIRYDYKIHSAVIRLLAEERFTKLWEQEFGVCSDNSDLTELLLTVVDEIKAAYPTQPTYTLVTKIILGTLGSLPACDTYFLNGLKECKIPFSDVNRPFLKRLLEFSHGNQGVLEDVQRKIFERQAQELKIQYPIMKLVDMYFWTIGEKCQEGNSERST